MDEIVRQIRQLKTIPGAIDDILPDLRGMYRRGELSEMVTALNERKYATGRFLPEEDVRRIALLLVLLLAAGWLAVQWPGGLRPSR